MTADDDRSELFRSPPAREDREPEQGATDRGEAAMRRLRDPFAVGSDQEPTRPDRDDREA